MTIKITKKLGEIIYLLYRFRYLTTDQIQHLLHHKNNRRLTSWLKILRENNYISYEKIPHTRIYYYFLSNESKETLRNDKRVRNQLLRRVYREKDGTEVFINHSLFIPNILFYFEELCKEKIRLNFYTKTDLTKFRYLKSLSPEGLINMQGESGDIKRFFLEVIDQGTPKFAKEKLIDRYVDYADEGEWDDKTNFPFPDLLIVCPNEYSKNNLREYIEENCDEDFSFYLTTKDKVKVGAGLVIWKEVK